MLWSPTQTAMNGLHEIHGFTLFLYLVFSTSFILSALSLFSFLSFSSTVPFILVSRCWRECFVEFVTPHTLLHALIQFLRRIYFFLFCFQFFFFFIFARQVFITLMRKDPVEMVFHCSISKPKWHKLEWNETVREQKYSTIERKKKKVNLESLRKTVLYCSSKTDLNSL